VGGIFLFFNKQQTMPEKGGQVVEKLSTNGCSDECSSSTCLGFDYIECLMQSDGCKDKNTRGKIKGKCGVECTTNNDCRYNEECYSYKCVETETTIEEEGLTTEEKELSSKIELIINKIHSIKENDNKGYINKVTFTIKNGKDKTLKPVVKVYAYDKTNEDIWIEKNRGEFVYSIGIASGGEQAGSIDLYPRTFADLDTIKTVILKLYDENDKIIASVQDKFYIK